MAALQRGRLDWKDVGSGGARSAVSSGSKTPWAVPSPAPAPVLCYKLDTWWSQSASHRRLTALKRATHPQHCTVGVQVRPCGAARGAVHSGAPPGYLGSPTRCQQLPVSGGDKQSCLWMRPSVSWRAEWPHVTASALESSLHRSRTLACESCLAH